MTVIFERPTLTEDEKSRIQKKIVVLANQLGRPKIIAVMLALAIENMRLAKEVNIHRQERGFEPLPTIDP
jgi:phosphopantetheine adenylyltransferase